MTKLFLTSFLEHGAPPSLLLASVNVLVPNCKIYNDASCDISADGQLLAVFIPSSQRGFPDEGILAVYSLAPHNLGEMLYTKRFGQSATPPGSPHKSLVPSDNT